MTLERRYPEILRKLIAIVRTSSSLYNQDVGFQRTMDSAFKSQSQKAGSEILELINQILDKSGSRKLELKSVADVKRNWTAIQTAIDTFVDRTNVVKRAGASTGTGTGSGAGSGTGSGTGAGSAASTPAPVVFYDKNINKPQKKFNPAIDTSYGPFKPLLVDKPWSSIPLNKSLEKQPADDDHQGEWYLQPYEKEIQSAKYPEFVYEPSSEIQKPDATKIQDRSLRFVADRKSFTKMLKKLKQCNQIAVDLEHHDYRTYMGLTSLMQISTDSCDYIVDTLELHGDLQELNEVFCSPEILKVLHGARMDVLWLQRDLGLYIVNLFDTYHASCALGHARHSLAMLLEIYCQFRADKKFQMADWRQRPLTEEMQNYARADTHFLLYIAQEMRNQLIKENKLDQVLVESRKTAGKRYEKPEYNLEEPGWASIALKYRLNVNDHVLEALYKWRDAQARELDESPRYIMSNQVIVALVASKPTTYQGVIAGCSPNCTHLQRQCADELAGIISAALALPPRPVEFVTRKGRTGYNPSELFNFAELSRVKSQRLARGTIFQPHEPQETPTIAEINLEIVPKLGFKVESEQETEEKEEEEEASEPEDKEKSALGTQKIEETPEPEQSTKKRRIQVVESLDDFESKPKKTKKKQQSGEQAEAFDFANAAQVMKKPETQDRKSKRGGKRGAGPRGANQRTAKNAAKSVTYKKRN